MDMNKTIVNVGDRIWLRERGIDSRVSYGTVIDVKDYCIVTLQGDGWRRAYNLCAITGYVKEQKGNVYPREKYVWSKIAA